MMVFALLLNAIFIVGGVVVIVLAMSQRARRLEMQHRERLAMIERGMMPSPESDPARFEASLGRPGLSRYTTLGVAVVGIGVGLMLLIGVAGGAASAGVGIGGAIAVLGLAFIVNGYLRQGAQPPVPNNSQRPTHSPPLPPLGPTNPS